MNFSIQEICDQIAENREIVKKATFGEVELVRSTAAALITCAGKKADLEKLKECKQILRKNQGLFSDFRGYSELIIISKMSVQDDPEQYLADASGVYEILRDGKFFTSEIMALAALSIVDSGEKERSREIAEKARDLLAEMKKKHPFLVDNDSTAFAALLALTPKSISEIMYEVETCYEILKDTFPLHKGSEYALCQVLSIYDGDPKEKCEQVIRLYQCFKDNDIRYGKEHELAFLGVLASLKEPDISIVTDVADACECLKGHHGFGFLYMDKPKRLLFGSIVAAYNHSADVKDTAFAVSNAISAAIVQEIMMIILLTSASIAVHNASSSSRS